MQYSFLGNSGIKVSTIGLGTMNFGAEEADVSALAEVITEFVQSGGNFIDTADVYHGGKSEEVLGKALAAAGVPRSSVVIATKVMFGGPGPNDGGLSRKHIMDGIEGSLARLGTDYVDLYQIHAWDAQTAPEVWLATMKDLLSAGKIRALGVSNLTGYQLQKVIMLARGLGVPIATLQTQYNLLCRQTEFELLPCCVEEDVAVLCWSPLKGGWLTGKFKKDEAPDADTRVGKVEAGTVKKLQSNPSYSQFADDPQVWALLDALGDIAKAGGWTVPQVATRWLLQRPAVAAVLVGPKNKAQMRDLIGAGTFTLSADQMSTLTDASAVAVPYPWEMVWRVSARGVPRVDAARAAPLFPTKKLGPL